MIDLMDCIIYYKYKKLNNIVDVDYEKNYCADGSANIFIEVDYLENGKLKSVIGSNEDFTILNTFEESQKFNKEHNIESE